MSTLNTTCHQNLSAGTFFEILALDDLPYFSVRIMFFVLFMNDLHVMTRPFLISTVVHSIKDRSQ